MYVKTGIADTLPADEYVEQQNNRDFERSYEVFKRRFVKVGTPVTRATIETVDE